MTVLPTPGARARAGFWFWARPFVAAAALVLATGCAQMVPQTMQLRTGWPAGVPQTTEIASVPFFPQDDYQCGPAALATVLAHTGTAITPDPLVAQVYIPARQGSLQRQQRGATNGAPPCF